MLYQRGASEILIPLYHENIHAGFESPAADYEEESIDLNAYVTKYPHATFYARVVGDCMTGSGIYAGDLLVVDRSLTPSNGDVVVGILDNDFILRSYYKSGTREYLMPDNIAYQPITCNSTTKFEIWGVVPYTILDQKKRIHDRLDRLEQFLR